MCPLDERVVVAAIGDSITAGSPGWDPDPVVRAGIASPDPASQWGYWAERAEPRLQVRNGGVYGERADEIRRRLGPLLAGADLLVVQGGINDVAQGRPVEPAAGELAAMVGRGRERGLPVALAELLPWNNGWPAAESAIRRLNELVRAVAADAGAVLLAFHDVLEDPARPGRMRPEWTVDGDHPSVAAYRRLGELAAATLAPLLR